MVNDDLRRDFLLAIGETYALYGYPEACGWIEGLLHLETGNWTQTGISQKLKEILPESKYPTSVPSINRAMKILETYGVVSKAGSRRAGFSYTLAPTSTLVSTMLSQMIASYEVFIEKMQKIGKQGKEDKDLKRAVKRQVSMAREWNAVISKSLELMNKR